MNSREKTLTSFLRSRGMAILAGVGFVAMIAGKWERTQDLLLAFIFLILATSVSMIYINRKYNLLRTLSVYYAGLFLIMAGSFTFLPDITLEAVCLPLLLLGCSELLYKCYDTPANTRPILTLFTLLSAASYLNFDCIYYIPVFMLGMVVMKCSKGIKPWIAAIIGLCIPWWLIWAFSPDVDIVPQQWYISGYSLAYWHRVLELPVALLIPALFTLIVIFVTWLMNMVKILAYNAHDRAFNGLLSLLTIGTWLMAILDFAHIAFYMPMLCCVAAFQMGHFFRIFLNSRAYVIALAVLGAYIGFYLFI